MTSYGSITTIDPVTVFLQVPLFSPHSVRKYGDLEFNRGGSLAFYRYLVLAAERKIGTPKPFIHVCRV